MGFFVSLANHFRDIVSTEEVKELRQQSKQNLEMMKIASIISVIVGSFFFAVFPSFFTFFILGMITFTATEIHKIASNGLEIINDATLELKVKQSQKALDAQMLKNTLLVGSLYQLVAANENDSVPLSLPF